MKFNFDYRQVYSTVLRDHLGLDNVRTQTIFQSTFERLPIYKNSTEVLPDAAKMELMVPWPNPARGTTLLQYGVFEEATISLALFDLQGRELKIIDAGLRKVGSYSARIDLQSYASGHYLISLSSNRAERITHQLVIE
jgi:hypothetical protein